MNSNVASKNYRQKDNSVHNMYLVMKKINETVYVDETLKRRTRNGGFIAWPKEINHQNLQNSTYA